MLASALAFTSSALEKEIVRLDDGKLAERTYCYRRRKFGWLVYSANLVAEKFYTDAQWARRVAR
jgi:hypothetical protein